MKMKQIQLTINETEKLVSISGIGSNNISINYTSDVDLTALVNALEPLIEDEANIEITEETQIYEDEKLNLVLNCIKDIVKEFNDVINTQEQEVSPDDLPF